MANVKFNLKNLNDPNKETLIFLFFRYQSGRLKYSTGLRIKPKFWNGNAHRAKSNRQFPQAPELNALLDALTNATLTTHRKYLNDGKLPTFQQLKDALDIVTYRKEVEEEDKQPSLIEFFEQLIEERTQNPKFANATVKVYRTAYNHLIVYKKKHFKDLDFDTIDLDFFNKYTTYLFNKKQFSQNHVNKLITSLKTVLNEATERGVNKNVAFRSKKFRVPKEEAKNIYLTLEELKKLNEFNLGEHPKLERVRDLFIVGAFTGLRFSDFTNIRPEHIREIDEVKVIDILTQKTKEQVTIPMHPIVGEIFEKYKKENSVLPRTISNQKMNQYLKELGKLVGFNDEVINYKSVGGRRVEEKKLKYEMISTHTARRSFATNAFKSGISSTSIMKITGHKTESSFMKYIKVTKEENAVLMAENAFFKKIK